MNNLEKIIDKNREPLRQFIIKEIKKSQKMGGTDLYNTANIILEKILGPVNLMSGVN